MLNVPACWHIKDREKIKVPLTCNILCSLCVFLCVCVRKTVVRRQGKVRSILQIFAYSVWFSSPPAFPTSAAGCCLQRHAKRMKAGNISFCFGSLEPWFVARQLSIMPFWFCLYLWTQTCCLHAFPNPKALSALPWKVQLVWWQLQKHFVGWEAKQESVFSGLLPLLWCSAVSNPTATTLPALHCSCHTFIFAIFGFCLPSVSLPWQFKPLLPCLWARQGRGLIASSVRDHDCHVSWRPMSFLTAPGLYTLQPQTPAPCCAPCLCWPACTGEWAVPSSQRWGVLQVQRCWG